MDLERKNLPHMQSWENLNQGNIVLSFVIDFKKAFDFVDHVILLAKLFNYG